jgi:TetR/AcrR family tetracycline transcriptional repressor
MKTATPIKAMKVSKDQIVQEAIALLYEQGLRQVTLRNLAERLSMRAPSLFWHIRNKDELLALIDEAIFRQCVESIPPSKTWQEWLHYYGLALWEAQCKAPDIPNLITQVNLGPEVRQTLYQLLYDELVVFGIDMHLAMKMQSSVQALVTGWTVLTSVPRDQAAEQQYSPRKSGLVEALDALIHGWEAALRQE